MTIHKYAAVGDVDRVRKELAQGVAVDVRDEENNTPLACAVARQPTSIELVRLLIEQGADVNAMVGSREEPLLSIAACSGSLEACQLLLDAGAQVDLATDKGYTSLIHCMFALHGSDRLMSMIQFFLRHGANIDQETDYGESPVRVALRLNRFDALRLLLDQGADPAGLQWSALARAVVIGTVEEVASVLASRGLESQPDCYRRTPGILAAIVGSVEKGQLLRDYGWDVNEASALPETALIACAQMDHVEMLTWLIGQGAELDFVDEWHRSALAHAAGAGSPRCVELLLEAGANTRLQDEEGATAMGSASSMEIVRLLQAAGEEITDISTSMRRKFAGLPTDAPFDCSPHDYAQGKRRQFGKRNPQRMDLPFWRTMIRVGCSAYQARRHFNDTERLNEAVWCYSRFGSSFTELPDGRFVQIAGEHEDYYDPDFCIYNDVVVYTGVGEFQIYGYPAEVFPPTDFHTATYWEGSLYIVGSLGYMGTRRYGHTPVYRLLCKDWSIQEVQTSGDVPGWIFKHRASIARPATLVVSGGKVAREKNGEETHEPLEGTYSLDLANRKWERMD